MVAPDKFHLLPSAIFPHRSPPEFAAPHDQCVFHHSTFFQIFQQSGDGLIDLPASLRETDVQSFPGTRTVAIPSPVIKLNKAHTAFGKTPGYQTIVGKACFACLRAVLCAHGFGFLPDVHRVGGIHLHAERHFILRNARERFWVAELRIALLIDFIHRVEHFPALRSAHARRAIEKQHGFSVRTALHALINAGQKTGAPKLLAPVGSIAS